jgi:hypothetical protein
MAGFLNIVIVMLGAVQAVGLRAEPFGHRIFANFHGYWPVWFTIG